MNDIDQAIRREVRETFGDADKARHVYELHRALLDTINDADLPDNDIGGNIMMTALTMTMAAVLAEHSNANDDTNNLQVTAANLATTVRYLRATRGVDLN
jgi:hypothetical protein